MNILFIGPYRQQDEWGCKSRAVLKCLQNTEHIVTSRPVYLSASTTYDQYVEPSEDIIADNYDILIQFLLPSFAIYKGNFKKRIGIFQTETIPNNIPLGELTNECLMDEIWVDSKRVAKDLQNIFTHYNSNTKVKAIPPTLNLDNYPLQPPLSIRESSPHLKELFLFYYIGNILESKTAFKEIYTAYINAFTIQDPVGLVVGLESAISSSDIEQRLNDCRNSLTYTIPKTHYPNVHVVTPQHGILNMEEKLALHRGGDCMINLSYAMTNPSTVLEGVLYHSTPIVNQNSTIHEWLGEDNIWCVDSYEEVCMSPKDQIPTNLYRYTSGESWYQPTIKSITKTMKQAYTDKFKRDNKRKENAKIRQYFQDTSYNHILSIQE